MKTSKWNKGSACVAIKVDPKHGHKVWEKLNGWNWTLGAWETTGEWDYIAWLDAKSWEDLHKRAMEIREWAGVKWTSSHLVYDGAKNGQWWWESPAGAWVWGRKNGGADGTELVEKGWVTSWFSVPGEWDSLFWVQGKSWDEVWEQTHKLHRNGWETSTQVPMRRWWNEAKLKSWN